MKKLTLLCEVLRPPLDEGIRAVAAELAVALSRRVEVQLFGAVDAEVHGMPVQGVLTDRYFMGRELAERLKEFWPQAMLYIPWTSLTSRTFLRIRSLRRCVPGIPLGVVALQPRGAGWLARRMARLGAPDRLFAMGPEVEWQAGQLSLECHRLEGGVDLERFSPLNEQSRADLRKALGLPGASFVALHVGHLKMGRGIRALRDIQSIDGVQAVLIASSSTQAETEIRRELQTAGVRVIDQHLPRIEEYYKVADCYVFPVTSRLDSIELPLSVLEAMACNLPVVTTRFGGLPALLEGAGDSVRIVDGSEKISSCVGDWVRNPPVPDLRRRVEKLTWGAMAERILESLEAAAQGAAFRNSEIRF